MELLLPACAGISSGAGVVSATSEALCRAKTDPCSGRAAARGSVSSDRALPNPQPHRQPLWHGSSVGGDSKSAGNVEPANPRREHLAPYIVDSP